MATQHGIPPHPTSPVLAQAAPLLEREAALEAIEGFCDQCLIHGCGVLEINGPPGSGHSRLLTEIARDVPYDGAVMLLLHPTRLDTATPFASLIQALHPWLGVLPSAVDSNMLLSAMNQRLADLEDAQLIIVGVDDIALLDPDSHMFLQRLLQERMLHVAMALIYTTTNHDATRAFIAPVQERIELAPLSPAGIRRWLQVVLGWHASPTIVDWLHQGTGGRPARIQQALTALIERGLLHENPSGWQISLDRTKGALGAMLGWEDHQPPHNLPVNTSSLVGRTDAIQNITALLEQHRLVTLLGPGGIGKTRLALAVGQHALPHFSNGVFFVSLVGVSDPQLILSTIAQTVGLKLIEGQPLALQLVNALREQQVLLVLDNCEHLLEGVDVLAVLLSWVPQLTILATSRERLSLRGEMTFIVEGLPYPRETHPAPDEEFPAMLLFAQRASAVDPTFAITPENRPAVARICQLSNGMPLAIELSAAWVRILSCQQIADGVCQSLDFLTTHLHSVSERHRSLRAVFAYSWGQLDSEEQRAVRQLSIFRGGIGLAAAEVVVGVGIPLLEALLDKSLIQRQAAERYEMHELLRQFALEQLAQMPEEQEQLYHRYLDYYCDLARMTGPKLKSDQQAVYMTELEEEHHNLRAALNWACEHGEVERALQLSSELGYFWYLHGHLQEGRSWLERTLAAASPMPSPSRALAINHLGLLAWRMGDYADAQAAFAESLALCTQLGYRRYAAYASGNLGLLAIDRGDYEHAHQAFEQCRVFFQELGDHHSLAVSLRYLGRTAYEQGDLAGAQGWLEQSLAIGQELGNDWFLGLAHMSLGLVALAEGQHEVSRQHLEASLAHLQAMGDKDEIAVPLIALGRLASVHGDAAQAWQHLWKALTLAQEAGNRMNLAAALREIAVVLARQGQQQIAAQLLGAHEALMEAIGIPIPPIDRPRYHDLTEQLRTQLGAEAFSGAWAEGRTMSLAQVIAFVQHF